MTGADDDRPKDAGQETERSALHLSPQERLAEVARLTRIKWGLKGDEKMRRDVVRVIRRGH